MRRQPAPQTQQNLENVHLSTEHQGLSTRDFTTPRICLPYAHVTPNVTPQGLCCPGGRRWQQASPMPRTAPVCEASKTPRETCRSASPSPPLQPPPGAGTCQGRRVQQTRLDAVGLHADWGRCNKRYYFEGTERSDINIQCRWQLSRCSSRFVRTPIAGVDRVRVLGSCGLPGGLGHPSLPVGFRGLHQAPEL